MRAWGSWSKSLSLQNLLWEFETGELICSSLLPFPVLLSYLLGVNWFPLGSLPWGLVRSQSCLCVSGRSISEPQQSGISWHSGGVVYSSSYSTAVSGLMGAQLIGIAHTAWSWRHTHTFSLSLSQIHKKNTRTHLYTHTYTRAHTPLFSLSLHPPSFSASLLLFYTHHPSPSSFVFITIENSPPGEELFLTKFVWGSLSLF